MHEAKDYGLDDVDAFGAAKRLGMRWTPFMGDWFTSWSPRNDNTNAEGTWFQWAHFAALILSNPLTEKVAPDLYRPDLPARTDIYTESDALLDDADIIAAFDPRGLQVPRDLTAETRETPA